MEGGQKTAISLESPIDVKSSDMLVSITNPQFAHNRQKYQGQCLPSSLRFEADGWAAGNTVYDYDSLHDGYISGNWKIKRSILNNNPAYLFEYYYKNAQGLYDYVGNICFNTTSSIQNQYNINRDDVNMTADTLTGIFRDSEFSVHVSPETDTSNNNTAQKFDITVNGSTGVVAAGETADISTLRFQCEVQNNGICVLKISDLTTSTGDIAILFKKASRIMNGDYNVADYTGTENNVHFYSKYDKSFTVDNNVVSSNAGTISDTVVDENTLTFNLTYTYTTDMQFTILAVEQINYLYDCIAEKMNGSLFDIEIDDAMKDGELFYNVIDTSVNVGKVRAIVPYKLANIDNTFVSDYDNTIPFTIYNMYNPSSSGK